VGPFLSSKATKTKLAISAIGEKSLKSSVHRTMASPCGSGTGCMVPIRLGSFAPCDPATGPARRAARHGARRAPTVAGVRHGARGIRLVNPCQAEPSEWLCAPVVMAHRHGSRGMQQHQRAGQNALCGPFISATPLCANLTKSSPSLRVELVVGFVPRAGRVLMYGYILVGWCRWGESGTLGC